MGLRCGGGGEGCGDGPRLAPFHLGRARGGQASGRLGSPACGARASPLSRESACTRRGGWAPAAVARRWPEQGQRAGLSWGRGRGPAGPASRRSRRPVRAASAAPSPFCRRAAAGEVPPAHAFRRASPRACSAAAGACVRSTLAPRLLRARFTLGFGRAFLLCSRAAPCTR